MYPLIALLTFYVLYRAWIFSKSLANVRNERNIMLLLSSNNNVFLNERMNVFLEYVHNLKNLGISCQSPSFPFETFKYFKLSSQEYALEHFECTQSSAFMKSFTFDLWNFTFWPYVSYFSLSCTNSISVLFRKWKMNLNGKRKIPIHLLLTLKWKNYGWKSFLDISFLSSKKISLNKCHFIENGLSRTRM